MARIVVYLLDPELNALNQLAQQEYRHVKAQAALIIRTELQRLGLVTLHQATQPLASEAETSVKVGDMA